MPHHKSGCTAAIQPSCHHQRLLEQQGASMYGPLRVGCGKLQLIRGSGRLAQAIRDSSSSPGNVMP